MNITLGVTGSISAYKAYDLVRLLVKNGNQVQVILTRGAEKFIRAETFYYLGAINVYGHQDDFSYKGEKTFLHEKGHVLHVNLARWSDKLIIAPLSANSLAHLCAGQAHDLLSSLFLAWKKEKPLMLFPAMNTEMLTHPYVQENLAKIDLLPWVHVFPTVEGELACGDRGAGKLLSPEEILALSLSYELKTTSKKILITAGATLSPLDSIRYLTNPATGKTALSLIEKSLARGHQVVVIAGKKATHELDLFHHHPLYQLKRVVTTKDMLEAVINEFPSADVYISTAAINDIEFSETPGKLKKDQLKDALPINKAPDILGAILKIKKPHQKIVGFAAEAKLTDDVLNEKIARKPVDFLVGTQVSSGFISGEKQEGFEESKAYYRLVQTHTKDLTPVFGPLEYLSKSQIANAILENTQL